jgi:hypothetical protein
MRLLVTDEYGGEFESTLRDVLASNTHGLTDEDIVAMASLRVGEAPRCFGRGSLPRFAVKRAE